MTLKFGFRFSAIRCVLSIATVSLSLAQEAEYQSVLWNGKEQIPLAALERRSRQIDSFDRGLGADFLLEKRKVQQGKSAEVAGKHFLRRAEAKLEIEIPLWWRQAVQFKLRDSVYDPNTRLDWSEFASLEELDFRPEHSAMLEGVFFSESGRIAVTIYRSKGEASILVLDQTGKKIEREISHDIWCPLTVEVPDPKQSINVPAKISIAEEEGRVIVFGYGSNRLFISVLDIACEKLLFHFVASENAFSSSFYVDSTDMPDSPGQLFPGYRLRNE